MARRDRLAVLATLVAGLAGIVLALTAGSGHSQGETMLRVAIQADPTTLDPALTNDPTGTAILQNVYTPLVDVDARGQVHPLAAKSWTVSPDGRTYRFVLRDDLVFHSGRKATAADVKYSLDRLADAKVNAPNASLLLSPIEGYEDAKGGKATELRGVKALSPNEVEIRVDRPAEGDLLVRLAHVSTGIVARESVEKGGANWSTTQANGTGPFRLAEWSLRQRIALAAHPGYFGGAPKIGKVVFEIVPEPAVGVQKYEAGELDIVQVPASDYGRLKADPKLGQELAEFNRAATVFLMLNQKAYAPFKDIRVRQAVAHAINRPQMARTALQGLYEAASGVLPPGFPGNTGALPVIPFDPARAKTLLTEAGFPGGKGLPPLVLGPNPRGFGPRLAAEVVAAMLQENLGMQVQVQVLDIAKWRQDLRKADVFAGVTGWTADIADPNYYLFALFDTKAPFAYFSGYASPAYEEKLATANREPNRAELLKKLRDVEQFLVVTDVGVVPLYHIREVILRKPYVRNLTFTPYGLGFMEHLGTAAIVR
jgi:oligopeptide transport system substrate-binding protein